MKRFIYCLFIGVVLLSVKSFAQTNDISIISRSIHAPVFKNVSVNPILKIEINLQKTIVIKSISFKISDDVIQSIDKLELYDTDTVNKFSSKNLLSIVKSIHGNFIVSINKELRVGKQYFWLSVTLNGNASMDKIISIQALQLIDNSGNKYPINEEKTNVSNPIGIAIRKAGDDNVNTFRIPGITTTNKKTLVAVYDIRYDNSKDLPANIDVGMSRSTDGGRTWQPMKVIIDMGLPAENSGVGDPSILFDPITKKIWVAALWSKGNHSIAGSKPGLSPDETGQFMVVNSDDDGLTWSKPINITTQVKNPAWRIFFQGPGNGTAMQNGTLVFPAQYWDSVGMPHSTIIYSTDHGANWKRGNGAKTNTTESQVIETEPGTLMLNMRDNGGSFRSVAVTKDMGETWVPHAESFHALPDPVCMGSLIKATVKINGINKEVLFFSNPNSSKNRDSITVKASLDFGKTWLPANQLLIDERGCYGYSALTKIDDNTLGLIYEGIKDLYFIRIPINRIIK